MERRLVQLAAPARWRLDDHMADCRHNGHCHSGRSAIGPLASFAVEIDLRCGHGIRGILSRHSPDPANLLGLLRPACLLRRPDVAAFDSYRRARMQYLGLQL